MNYQKIYESIINKAKSENRKKHNGTYYENNHIKPRCLNGGEEKENKVLLTAKEHFICHKLLLKIYPNSAGLNYAYYAMVYFPSNYRKDKIKFSSRDYEYAKELFIEAKSKTPAWNKGLFGLYKCSQKTKNKLSELSSGENNGMHNKKHTKEAKEKISKANSGENNGIKKMVKINPDIIKGKNNHASKEYKITTPNNEIIIIKGLRKFCEDNNLFHSNMIKVANGKQKHHRNYKCERL